MVAKRAALYLRLSVAQDDVQSDSIRRQEADLRALCEREGWEVVEVLADDGISGRKVRANATEALRMLRDREADVLAVWKLDRFSRQGLGAIGDLVETLDATPGALFVALQDGLRSDQAAWRLVAAVLSEVARTEADNTSLRIAASIRSNRADGRFVGGTVPFGFRPAPREGGGRTLKPHAPEVAIIHEVARRILDGESQARLLGDLTARGVPTTRSAYRIAQLNGLDPDGLDRGSWSYSGLSAVWTGDSLLGRLSRSRPVIGADGRTRKVWELVRDSDGSPLIAHEPILDGATAERLRTHLRDPKNPKSRTGPRRERHARLLSGVIFCDDCGQRLWVTTSGGRTVYTCAIRAGRCSGPNMKVENAERAVRERFLAIAGAWPEVKQIEEVTAPATIAALADTESAIREALAELQSDGVDGAAILGRVDALKARRAELQAIPSAITVRTIPTGRTIAEAWETATDESRRRILSYALDHVTLAPTETKGRTGYHPERIRIIWNS
jgi:DNA invertase Pin-like site-specific DNA recombinase